MKKKVVPKLRQEVKVDISYTGKVQDFTARYIIKLHSTSVGKILEKLTLSTVSVGDIFVSILEKLRTAID